VLDIHRIHIARIYTYSVIQAIILKDKTVTTVKSGRNIKKYLDIKTLAVLQVQL